MDGESLLLFYMRGAVGGRGSERWEEQEVWVREVGEREVGGSDCVNGDDRGVLKDAAQNIHVSSPASLFAAAT